MRHIHTNEYSTLEPKEVDMVITSNGYEDRCSYISEKYKSLFIDSVKICLAFSKNNKLNNHFENLGYTIYKGHGDDDFFVERILKQSSQGFCGRKIKLVVDYSSMTRVWYASILRFFYNSAIDVEIFFVYSFSKFLPPPKTKSHNVHVRPLDGFSTFSIPDKPTALLIGLGYEPMKANGLTEFFDAETFIFYNDKSTGEEFSHSVENVNKELIDATPIQNIFRYPIGNLSVTEKILNDLCRVLKEKYRIVIAPTGPKPFTLLSLICSLRHKNIDVWRVSAGENAEVMNREANGNISILRITIESK